MELYKLPPPLLTFFFSLSLVGSPLVFTCPFNFFFFPPSFFLVFFHMGLSFLLISFCYSVFHFIFYLKKLLFIYF